MTVNRGIDMLFSMDLGVFWRNTLYFIRQWKEKIGIMWELQGLCQLESRVTTENIETKLKEKKHDFVSQRVFTSCHIFLKNE